MNKIITYQDYLSNGGFVIPELNSYDQDNQINTIEEKFNKFLTYTQIQLNYVLQDKLEGVEYNLLNIDEPYRRDIINILVIRLNRAFENDRLIPRDENTQYSEMGAINWSSMSDMRNEAWGFWNEQELNIIETSGLRSVVSLWCQDYDGGQYPTNLTNDMANRLMSDDSLEINTKVNPSNGLTSIEFKASKKMANKSEIPQVDNLATKEELKQKLDLKIAEQYYAKKTELPNIKPIQQLATEAKQLANTNKSEINQLTNNKINKQTFNHLSEAIINQSNRHQLLISKYKLIYNDANQRKEWTFPNKNLYDKVKKFKDDFKEQADWNDSNLKVSYIWVENHDFEIKCFAILEEKFIDKIDLSGWITEKDIKQIKPPEFTKAEFEQKINEIYQQINMQTIKKLYEYYLPLSQERCAFLYNNQIKIAISKSGYNDWKYLEVFKDENSSKIIARSIPTFVSKEVGHEITSQQIIVNFENNDYLVAGFHLDNDSHQVTYVSKWNFKFKKIAFLMTQSQKKAFDKLG